MHFDKVSFASIGATLPTEVWSSQQLEQFLRPLYERLKLPEGRLALMSGIHERRVWDAGTLPSEPSIQSGLAAIEASGIAPAEIGCLIHASVCRDFLEPATASRVHHGLGLGEDCWVYDVSNACLGLLNGVVQIANLIQAGAIRAGIVLGTENSRPLLEQTIAHLNGDTSLTRKSVKPAFASLTIGSGSCAFLLSHRDLAPEGSQLKFAVAKARTQFHDLCRSDQDSAGAGMAPLMETDSERLLIEGVATGAAAFKSFQAAGGWASDSIDRSVCHQVGGKHRALMLEAMGLPVDRDVATFGWLGNTGSVALPLSVAAGAHWNQIQAGERVGMFGIGSGINSVMLGCEWGTTPVAGNLPESEPVFLAE
ncbi:3-oxoacyl-[acyl-carrier-protein] synthase 3 [Roseimaritima multifibrata]|uniref:3-oxoacyl-[acyl-carrier-protein] synthase 3 n=1 Tax=Roseimaritima multifibrata TaxID=1930274 RepID=A0A517MDT8_9BACT|nr:3-oxoacyl-ACP synthase III [Roseimaritima multifibrata]QDS93048.1 3-oxoacyl-[acyl-carrier-protein] synthase 3 [Roseimaritima multifibrata]